MVPAAWPRAIAVVHDDEPFLSLCHDLLTRAGYWALILLRSTTAYARIRLRQPALVLLDIRPEHPGSGWRVLQLLWLDPATTHIPVIVTAVDRRLLGAKVAALQSKGGAVLQKPFTEEELLAAIRAAIGPPPSTGA
jgi:DNA-binding response OmpR family regulator